MENLEGWNKLVGDKVNVRRRVLPSCVAPFYSSAGVLRGSDDRALPASWQDFGPCGRQSGVSCQAFQDPYGDEHAGDQPVRREGNGEKVFDLLVFGDKPITLEVPRDKEQSLKLGVMGVCRLYATSEMSASLYRRDDGSQGISYKKIDKDFMFSEFAVNPAQQGK